MNFVINVKNKSLLSSYYVIFIFLNKNWWKPLLLYINNNIIDIDIEIINYNGIKSRKSKRDIDQYSP